jgi:hypothetical protein
MNTRKYCMLTHFHKRFGKFISYFLLILMSIQLYTLYGCNKDNPVSTQSSAPTTTTVNGQVNTSEIGGNSLQVQSVYKLNSTVNNGSYSSEVSNKGCQFLIINDALNQVRGLTFTVFNNGIPSPIECNALSTALTLIFLTPGISSTNPDTLSNRTKRLESISSFQQFVNYLEGNLLNLSLNNIINTNQTKNYLYSIITEYSGIDTNNIKKNKLFDSDPYFFATKSENNVNLKNYNWRFVNVYRRDVKFDGNSYNPILIKSTMGGGIPYSWSCIFTATCLNPTEENDNQFNNVQQDVNKCEYWVVGPGCQYGETPPSGINTNYYVEILTTDWIYLICPIIDFASGCLGIGISMTQFMQDALDIASNVKDFSDVITAANGIINASNIIDLISSLIDLSQTVLERLLEEQPCILVTKHYISSQTAEFLRTILPLFNIVFGASNAIIAGVRLHDSPKFSKYLIFTGIPQLLNPPNGAANQSITPILQWLAIGANFSSYDIQVSTTNSFSNLVVNTSIPGNLPRYDIPNGKLNINTQYFWRIRTVASDGTSNWSQIWNFTTGNTSNNVIVPLSVGNWWTYDNGTTLRINGTTNINNHTCYNWEWDYSGNKWYFLNQSDGMWCYGGYSNGNISGNPDLLVKYPVINGNSWSTYWMWLTQPLTATLVDCQSTNATYGNYTGCYKYHFQKIYSEDILLPIFNNNLFKNKIENKIKSNNNNYAYDYYWYIKPNLGEVGVELYYQGTFIDNFTLTSYHIQ